jgi:molecular chaperone GrpE
MFEEVPRETNAERESRGDSGTNVTNFTNETKEQLEAVKSQLEESERERKQYREMAQRAQADLVNYRRRVDEERDEMVKQATSRFVAKLLPAVDELGLAVEHAAKQGAEAAWLQGVSLVHQKLSSILQSEGLQRLNPAGQRFDPWEHEALMYTPAPPEKEGTVLTVVRDGYKLHGKLIRPAQVIVAKAAEQSATEPKAEQT